MLERLSPVVFPLDKIRLEVSLPPTP